MHKLLTIYSFSLTSSPDSLDEIDTPSLQQHSSNTSSLLQQRLASYKDPPGRREVKKPPRDVQVKLSMTETDFVVVEDTKQLNSNAVVLKVKTLPKYLALHVRNLLCLACTHRMLCFRNLNVLLMMSVQYGVMQALCTLPKLYTQTHADQV